ncbi:hypothetical protein BJV78DRAFT_1253989, partial [Lactifluus subvellereus]
TTRDEYLRCSKTVALAEEGRTAVQMMRAQQGWGCVRGLIFGLHSRLSSCPV